MRHAAVMIRKDESLLVLKEKKISRQVVNEKDVAFIVITTK